MVSSMGTTLITPELTVDPRLHSVLWGRFLAPFLAGDEPYVRHLALREGAEIDESLVPHETVVGQVESDDQTAILAHIETCAVLILCRPGSSDLFARAATRAVIERIVERFGPAVEPVTDDNLIPVDFWQTNDGAYTITRQLEAPTWEEIAGHYPAEVATRIGSLAAMEPSTDRGRIILWHGSPGTGKTTAIRALARSWVDKCRFQVVVDPDVVFARSSILMEVLLSTGSHDPDRLRVLVVEDADELVREDAKDRVGQALSRLLNLGDGILGQGMKVLVLITTNEPVRRLHPALIRPGRCLAEIEFRPFSRSEAIASFGPEIPGGQELTLAHIMQGGADVGSGSNSDRAPATGMYL